MSATPRRPILNVLVSFSLLLALLGGALVVTPAHASTTIHVNSNLDVLGDDGICTLREAIASANTDTASGAMAGECAAGSGTDTIVFDANFTITLSPLLGALMPSTNMTIDGNGTSATIIQADACDPTSAVCTTAYPVFSVTGGNISMYAMTVQHGSVAASGGGIFNNGGVLSLSQMILSKNRAGSNGGGIYNAAGAVNLYNSTVDGNVAAGEGGGILNSAAMWIQSDTFSNNSAALGGGISNEGLPLSTMFNSTLGSNSAPTAGGLYNHGDLNIYNSTVAFNTTAGTIGGIDNVSGDLSMTNVMLADNDGFDCSSAVGLAGDISNLIKSNSGGAPCGSPAVTTDPGTLTFGANGGPTKTFAIDGSSSAYGAANLTACNASPVNGLDQRGFFRKTSSCDIGAYEFHPAPPNDEFATAAPIPVLPFNDSLDTQGATTGTSPADPVLNCTGSQRYHSVWYSFTPPSSEVATVNTYGSNYDTVLQVWTGASVPALAGVPFGCTDDAQGGFGTQSIVTFAAAASTTYTIEVTSYGDSAGVLQLHVRTRPGVADFDGNGTTDVSVYRPPTNGWFVKSQFSTVYGLPGDLAVPGDYDGNGTMDVAVFRPASASWFVKGQFAAVFGLPGDVPVPGDYNADGITDLAVYRPATSAWFVKGQFATIFGVPGDIPIPGDYDGNGTMDIAVFRPSTNSWFVQNQFSTVYGLSGDIPVPADYNGDRRTDVAVYRPSSSGWFIQNQGAFIYGLPGDVPVPGDYDANVSADLAVFRPTTLGWFVKNQFATIYGLTGDYPLPAPDTNADGDPYQ